MNIVNLSQNSIFQNFQFFYIFLHIVYDNQGWGQIRICICICVFVFEFSVFVFDFLKRPVFVFDPCI